MRLARITFKPWATIADRYAVAMAIRDQGGRARTMQYGATWEIEWPTWNDWHEGGF